MGDVETVSVAELEIVNKISALYLVTTSEGRRGEGTDNGEETNLEIKPVVQPCLS